MKSTTMISSIPALRIPPYTAKKKNYKLLFCIVFIGCYIILVIYSETNMLNRVYNKDHAGSMVQEAMHATPTLNAPIQKTTSTAEQEEGDIKKKVIPEQEQQTSQAAKHKRIGSHNDNNNNNDGAASNRSTSNAAGVQE